MQSAITLSPEVDQDTVLTAYADTATRADFLVGCIQTEAQTKLDAARQALGTAEEQVRLLDNNRERAYLAAMKTHEQDYRKASTEHGLAMTGALNEHDERNAEIEKRFDESTEPERKDLTDATNSAGAKKKASTRPWYDSVNVALFNSRGVRDRELADSYQQYLSDKARIDAAHAEKLATIAANKDRACTAAQQTFDEASAELIVPARQAMAQAQALYNKDTAAAEIYANNMAHERLAIWKAFNEGRLSGEWAVRSLHSLHQG